MKFNLFDLFKFFRFGKKATNTKTSSTNNATSNLSWDDWATKVANPEVVQNVKSVYANFKGQISEFASYTDSRMENLYKATALEIVGLTEVNQNDLANSFMLSAGEIEGVKLNPAIAQRMADYYIQNFYDAEKHKAYIEKDKQLRAQYK